MDCEPVVELEHGRCSRSRSQLGPWFRRLLPEGDLSHGTAQQPLPGPHRTPGTPSFTGEAIAAGPKFVAAVPGGFGVTHLVILSCVAGKKGVSVLGVGCGVDSPLALGCHRILMRRPLERPRRGLWCAPLGELVSSVGDSQSPGGSLLAALVGLQGRTARHAGALVPKAIASSLCIRTRCPALGVLREAADEHAWRRLPAAARWPKAKLPPWPAVEPLPEAAPGRCPASAPSPLRIDDHLPRQGIVPNGIMREYRLRVDELQCTSQGGEVHPLVLRRIGVDKYREVGHAVILVDDELEVGRLLLA
eukprot:CAMPEP_0175612590 /NCGR_PEP_ID=MMETSP0096-20121207/63902_1 /TAXON_ID=311494 /ORGANISM="Alexandrium monilatum, Strain CCMP3105" /LENGTH=304 /DNA_ID=CAMNT_0016917641 /DNA_START=365 /DNA_END=1279 /DNA_ORIENTATION=-